MTILFFIFIDGNISILFNIYLVSTYRVWYNTGRYSYHVLCNFDSPDMFIMIITLFVMMSYLVIFSCCLIVIWWCYLTYFLFHCFFFLQVTGGNKGIGFAIVRGLCKAFDGDVYLTGMFTRNYNFWESWNINMGLIWSDKQLDCWKMILK